MRDIDDRRNSANIKRLGMAEGIHAMSDIDERGMRAVMEEALRAAGRGTAGYHVSLDMDWIDPEDAPGVGTPVRGGATCTARPTWPWRFLPIMDGCSASKSLK